VKAGPAVVDPRRRRALRRLTALVAAGTVLAVPAAGAAGAEPGGPTAARAEAAGPPAPPAPPTPPLPANALLPDLVQLVPRLIGVERVRERGSVRYHLGFASAVSNAGDGALVIRARRKPGERTMTADQIVRLRGGGHVRRPGIGTLRYHREGGHEHWHYMGFDRYELRDVTTGALVSPDRKTGFCLGDRYDETGWQGRRPLPPREQFRGLCGMHRPNARTMLQGISPGYGDDYLPHLEGQYVDITEVPPGPYVLVHRVNADRSLVESRYGNNAASARIRLYPPVRGKPRVRVMAQCPGFDTCPRRSPPPQTTPAATPGS